MAEDANLTGALGVEALGYFSVPTGAQVLVARRQDEAAYWHARDNQWKYFGQQARCALYLAHLAVPSFQNDEIFAQYRDILRVNKDSLTEESDNG